MKRGSSPCWPVMARDVPKVLTVDPGAIDELGFGELLEAADLAGVDMAELGTVTGNGRLRVMLAIAFVIARRADPNLSWQAAQRWKLEVVTGKAPDPTSPRQRGATNGQRPGPRSRSGSPSPR